MYLKQILLLGVAVALIWLPFTNNVSLFIQRSLTPAKVTNIDLDQDTMRANVYLEPDQVSWNMKNAASAAFLFQSL